MAVAIPAAPRAPSFAAPPSEGGQSYSAAPPPPRIPPPSVPPTSGGSQSGYRERDPSIDVEFDGDAGPAPKTLVRTKSSRPPRPMSDRPPSSTLTPSVRAYVASTTSSKTYPGLAEEERSGARLVRGFVVLATMGAGVFLGGAFIGGVLAPEAEPISTVQPLEYEADELEVPEVEPLPLIERAAQGQDSALLELDLKNPEEKTFEEILALAEGRQRRDQQEAYALGEKLAKTKPSDVSTDDVAQLLRYSGDPFTYRQAQVALAKFPHEQGPDWLYRVTRRYHYREEVVRFAEELLATKEVRANASPALKVLIDSWEVNSCDGARDLLERAVEVADNRSVRHLAKFAKKDGCGKGQAEDCYPCLRDDRLVVDALRAAQGRRASR